MIKVTVDTKNLNARLLKQRQALGLLPGRGLVEFKRLTPIRSGNARANTELTNKNEIVGDYPYAQRLEHGWSRQAPVGMIKPFTKWWTDQLKKIARIK